MASNSPTINNDEQAKEAKRASQQARPLFQPEIVGPAIAESFKKLNPRVQLRNPVMFVVEVGALITTIIGIRDLFGAPAGEAAAFVLAIAVLLWLTVVFANFAEAIAEGRGRAQADALRKTKTQTSARKLDNPQIGSGLTAAIRSGAREVAAPQLRKGDVVLIEAGGIIPGDGDVVEGVASVDESAITGESAPVIRESGGDRSAVTGGTRVLSDWIKVQITSNPGETFLDRMIALVEGAQRQKTPNEIALSILINGLTIIFLLATVTLLPFAIYSGKPISITILIALLVCLIPTTIGGLLSAIGIAGMDRMVQRNVLAMSGRAVEAAGDVDTLLLDKTGTITIGARQAVDFVTMPGVSASQLAQAARLSSLSDETPEGRSIVVLAEGKYGIAADEGSSLLANAEFIPFSATTRISGVNFGSNGSSRQIRKGAADAVRRYVQEAGGTAPAELEPAVNEIARAGATPLVVAENGKALGVINLKDIVKPGIRERFEELRRSGIRTVMITGDNRLTAAAIAAEAGVDDFLAEATPENKLSLIRAEQAKGKLVAMTGDGTNDAPALAQADVGVAMNTGTMAAKEAGNMVDLDSDPTKLIEIVKVGKQMLMTRGALTTFSISNDVAKYFAILPAVFGGIYAMEGKPGPLAALNVMGLTSATTAILSAVIFNALIIIALVPLALKGLEYKPIGAAAILRRNLLIYGLGGIVAPFVGIKIIDLILTVLGVK